MKKILSKVFTIFTALLLLFSVVLLVTAVVSKYQNKTATVFGYSFHYVVSPSMEPEIKVGDFVIAKKADISQAKVGDYVVFVSPDPKLKGIIIIHSVVDITQEGKLITSGIKEGSEPDDYPVSEIIGVYHKKSAFIGYVINFFSKLRNVIFLIIVLTAVIIAIKYSMVIIKTLKEKEKGKDEE